MRILIAYDGSAGADTASELVASLPWDADSTVRVVTVVPDARDVIGGDEAKLAAAAASALDVPRGRLADRALSVDTEVLRGWRPAHAVAELAESWSADLLVVGSRGLGAVGSGLLGSVSAEIVDVSPCPVLVARTRVVRGIVFATDGSAQAGETERFLAGFPVARQVPVRVVSVAHVIRAFGLVLRRPPPDVVHHGRSDSGRAAKASQAEIADATATRLRSVGIQTESEVRSGDPAGEIIAVAEGSDADLIVVGSRGQTGLRRIVLGSVARKVLYHASTSVLMVRGPREADVVADAPAD